MSVDACSLPTMVHNFLHSIPMFEDGALGRSMRVQWQRPGGGIAPLAQEVLPRILRYPAQAQNLRRDPGRRGSDNQKITIAQAPGLQGGKA